MNRKSIFSIVASIIFGFSLGLVYMQWRYPPRPPHFDSPLQRGDYFMRRFARHLDLSKEQRRQARDILESKREEMRLLHQELRPRIHGLHKDARLELRAILNPEQQRKFDKVHRKMEARRKRRFKKGHRDSFGRGFRGPHHRPPRHFDMPPDEEVPEAKEEILLD